VKIAAHDRDVVAALSALIGVLNGPCKSGPTMSALIVITYPVPIRFRCYIKPVASMGASWFRTPR
jgi:hypothetical protein